MHVSPAAVRVVFLLGILSLAGPALSKQVEEKGDDGTVRLRYNTDAQDRKTGEYQELFPSGKTKVRGTYSADKKTGTWTTYSEDGKPLEVAHYRNGMLDGPYQLNFPSGHPQLKANYHADDFAGPVSTFDDKGHPLLRVSYPRPWADVLKAWNTWAPKEREKPVYLEEFKAEAPYKAGKIAAPTFEAARKYTMLYRYLSGVPMQNLTVDPGLCDLAQHAAVLLVKLGHLSHTPDKPADMDDAFFKSASAGCGQSNLHQGQATLFDAIDGFMDDSDASNVEKIGHRQWVLAPGLVRTGFGSANGFTAMHVLTAGGGGPANYAFIAYPGEGYYPKQLLHADAAWSLHFAPGKVRLDSAGQMKITVTPLDEHFVAGDDTEAKVVSVITSGMSGGPVIVFRPEAKPDAGRYLVRVTGVRTPAGALVPFSYLVDLKEMPAPEPEPEPAGKKPREK